MILKAALTSGDALSTVGSLTNGSAGDREVEGATAGAAAPESPVGALPEGGASGKRRRRTGSSGWAIARATAGVLMKAPGRGRTGVGWGYAMSKVPAARRRGVEERLGVDVVEGWKSLTD